MNLFTGPHLPSFTGGGSAMGPMHPGRAPRPRPSALLKGGNLRLRGIPSAVGGPISGRGPMALGMAASRPGNYGVPPRPAPSGAFSPGSGMPHLPGVPGLPRLPGL